MKTMPCEDENENEYKNPGKKPGMVRHVHESAYLNPTVGHAKQLALDEPQREKSKQVDAPREKPDAAKPQHMILAEASLGAQAEGNHVGSAAHAFGGSVNELMCVNVRKRIQEVRVSNQISPS